MAVLVVAHWTVTAHAVHAIWDGDYARLDMLTRFDPFVVRASREEHLVRISVLSAAVSENELEMVKLLIRRGADVNWVPRGGSAGKTPLHFASVDAGPEMTKLLIQAGANVNVLDSSGWTPLHIAAGRGRVDIIKILLANRANPNLENDDGLLRLDLATKEGHKQAAAILRKASAISH